MTDKLSLVSLTSGTLSINPLFPVYGQDNPSQGFRDNFRNTQAGLVTAYGAINSLIDNEIVKGAGESTGMGGAAIADVVLDQWSQSRAYHTNSGSAITLYYTEGAVHTIANTLSNVSINLREFPTDGTFAAMRVYVQIANKDHTVTWNDHQYIANGANLGGYVPGTGVMSFISSGTYGIEVGTYTGDSFHITDLDARASGPLGNGGAVGTRKTLSTTTVSIPANNTIQLDMVGYRSYLLYKAVISSPSWVRIYTDSTARNDDLATGRTQSTDPSTAGVVAEFITSQNAQTLLVAPAVVGFNNEPTPVEVIPMAITNLLTTPQTVNIQLTLVQMEA